MILLCRWIENKSLFSDTRGNGPWHFPLARETVICRLQTFSFHNILRISTLFTFVSNNIQSIHIFNDKWIENKAYEANVLLKVWGKIYEGNPLDNSQKLVGHIYLWFASLSTELKFPLWTDDICKIRPGNRDSRVTGLIWRGPYWKCLGFPARQHF